MNPRRHLSMALTILALAAGTAAAEEDDANVTKVSGFRVPEYDEKGNLKSQLYGETARVYPNGAAEITQLKLDLYKENEVDLCVTAPHCLFDRRTYQAGSRGDVRIARDNVIVTGTGFKWEGRQEQFQILSQVRVVLKNVRRNLSTGVPP